MVNSQMSRTQLQAATRTKRWKILKAQTTHRAETATVVLEVPELELQVVISEKKVQDLVREVLMVAERRFCSFVSRAAPWSGSRGNGPAAPAEDTHESITSPAEIILSRQGVRERLQEPQGSL